MRSVTPVRAGLKWRSGTTPASFSCVSVTMAKVSTRERLPHIEPGTFMNNGFSHSKHIKLGERFRMSPDGNTLWLTQVYEDPETFEGVAARYMAWTRKPGEFVFPYECDSSYGN